MNKSNTNINLVEDSYVKYSFDNTFCIFNSINNIIYLIYLNDKMFIISYDVINNKKINEIKNSHKSLISCFRHCLDNIQKRDLIMSISAEDNNLKIWNFQNFNCLLNILNVNKIGLLLSACFFNNNNNIYIITSNRNWDKNGEPIKVYDLGGNIIKELKNYNFNTFIIDTYYDEKLSKNYIITGNEGFYFSYDYDKNEKYFYYYDTINYYNRSMVINNKEEIVKLIGDNDNGEIIIWNFHSGNKLKKIDVCDNYLCGISLWNKDFIFVACYDRKIRLININKELIINNFIGHEHSVISIKKFNHPKYGECLLSQGLSNDVIKLWFFNTDFNNIIEN